jgi:hypothetical protein
VSGRRSAPVLMRRPPVKQSGVRARCLLLLGLVASVYTVPLARRPRVRALPTQRPWLSGWMGPRTASCRCGRHGSRDGNFGRRGCGFRRRH